MIGLLAAAVAAAMLAGCSGEWYVGDGYYDDYYYNSCPRYRTYGPMNCYACHW